jgi:hypothetical protein
LIFQSTKGYFCASTKKYIKRKKMYKIETDSFVVVDSTRMGAFETLLKLGGYTIDSYSQYMAVSIEELEKAPQWAINSLKELIHLNLVHLGYIMKDSRVEGLMKPYSDIESIINKKFDSQEIEGSLPIKIFDDIISKDGAIRTHYLTNAENILREFAETD